MADDSDDDQKPKKPSPLEKYKWKAGQSGNPGGRTKGVASAAKAIIGTHGEIAFEILGQIMMGEIGGTKVRDRIEAIKILKDRAFGRSVDITAHTLLEPGQGNDEVQRLASDALLRLATFADPDQIKPSALTIEAESNDASESHDPDSPLEVEQSPVLTKPDGG